MAVADGLRDGRDDAATASTEAVQGGKQVTTCMESLLAAVRQQATAGAVLEAERSAEIERLKAEVQQLTTSKATLEDEAKAERTAHLVLEDEKKLLVDRIRALKMDKGELVTRVGEATGDPRRLVQLEKLRNELLVRLNEAAKKCGALEEEFTDANEQPATAKANRNPSEEEDANHTIHALKTVNNNLTAVVKALNGKHKELQTKYRAVRDELVTVIRDNEQVQPDERSTATGGSSENVSRRATVRRQGKRSHPAEVARRDFDARRLTEFMERTFACNGKKELLQAAVEAFYDNKPLDAAAGGRYAPKPVLLVHQVEIPQLGGTPAPVASLAPPAVPIDRCDVARSADDAMITVPASQRDSEEQEEKQDGSGEKEQPSEATKGSSDKLSSTNPLSRKRGHLPNNQEAQPTDQRAASSLPRTASESPSASHRPTTAGADGDAAPLLVAFSNPRRSATHYSAIAPRLGQHSMAFHDSMALGVSGGGMLRHQTEAGHFGALPSSSAPLTTANGRFDEARTSSVAMSAALASQGDAEESRREGSNDEEQSEGKSSGDRDRLLRKSSSRSPSRKRRRYSRDLDPRQTELRVGPFPTKHRRATEGADVDRRHSRSLASTPRQSITHDRMIQSYRSVRFKPSNQVSAVDTNVVSINEVDLRLLYEAEPWEAMYEKRPFFSYTVDYSALLPSARKWLEMALAFRHKFRWQLWEQQHWVMIARPHRSTTLARMLEERTIRQAQARFAWNTLVGKVDDLIRRGDLDLDVWHDPFLWCWTNEPRRWHPRSCNLVEELDALDEEEPARCFYVDSLRHHPFFASRLSLEYQQPHRLPPGF